MSEGDKRHVELEAKEAYGDFRADMIMEVPKQELAHLNVEMGAHLQLQLEKQIRVVKVTKITDTTVTLDGNHPLAGVDLSFDMYGKSSCSGMIEPSLLISCFNSSKAACSSL